MSAVAMKDSGVEWLGEIPCHWRVVDLSHVAEYINGAIFKPSDWSDVGLPIIRIQNLTGASDKFNYFEGDKPEQYRIRKGDVLISWSASIGVFIWHGEEAWLNQHIFKVGRLADSLSKEFFLFSLLHSINAIKAQTHGSTMKHIVRNDFLRTKMTLPPLHEQRAIASYLDSETAKIDRLINKTQALNALLSEKRVALISQAVTKGLDAGVEMKESGVEWLGEIPAHWDIRNFKYIARLQYGDSLKAEDRVNGDIPVFGSNGLVGYHAVSNTLAPAIVVGRKGSFGKVNYSNNPVFAIDTTYFLDERTTSEFLRWVYYSLQILELDKSSKDSAVPGLGREEVYSLCSAAPPLHEQRAIAAHLDRETAKIDSLINKNDELIALLREKRSALISAAVTGKISVPSVSASKS